MFTIDKKKFGAFVAQLRKEKGLTQREVAQQLFLSDKAVSKWETGASIPDTALLIPLAELLGVTVTELLLCERQEPSSPISSVQVEDLVKTALAYGDERPKRAYQAPSVWHLIYVLSVLLGALGCLLNVWRDSLFPDLVTYVVLGGIFGAYFCFFIRLSLPSYYDTNQIGGVWDGPFRMNLPGVQFNNRNWPHIVKIGRIWACATTALLPFGALFLHTIAPGRWALLQRPVLLGVMLGGLFFPMYIAAKRWA